jgi:uncharacterized membrane protein YjjP (DUF1212 family)
MTEYGRAYLASGGPTSRLEDSIEQLGRRLGHATEVFATPTGVFVSCVDSHGATHTALSRIKENTINLGRLCWLEGIFEDLLTGKISLDHAHKILHSPAALRPPYTFRTTVLAAWLFGFALSFPAFGMFFPAVASGLIAVATWWVSGPGLKKRISSSIFRDFVGATVTLALSAAFQAIVAAPFEAYSIGAIVVLVPGLALTTAIAELADQNLVSGTSKLMQAVLTLLAMGLAYLLFLDLGDALHLMPAPSAGPRPLSLGASATGIIVSVTCFGILFKVPPKSLPWATLTGFIGWSVLKQFSGAQYLAAASYLASFCVGIVSLGISQRVKVPSQVYSVPGIIALLPGMMALMSLRSLAMGQQSYGLDLGFRVALTAGGIVFGLFTARIPYALIRERRPRQA